jgi:hypothetical protein
MDRSYVEESDDEEEDGMLSYGELAPMIEKAHKRSSSRN